MIYAMGTFMIHGIDMDVDPDVFAQLISELIRDALDAEEVEVEIKETAG